MTAPDEIRASRARPGIARNSSRDEIARNVFRETKWDVNHFHLFFYPTVHHVDYVLYF